MENEIMENEQEVENEATEGIQEEVSDEALEATKPEETVPAAVAGGLRRRARDAENEAARLQGQLDAVTSIPAPEKSPVEKYMEEFGPDQPIDGATLLLQVKWEKKQVEDMTTQRQMQQQTEINRKSVRVAEIEFSTEKAGKGLDLHTVCDVGSQYLTAGDRIDIANAGDNAAHLAYKRCRQRVLESGTDDAKDLQRNIDAHKTKLKPKVEGKPEPKLTSKQAPSQQEILDETGTHHDPHIGQVFDLD